MHLDSNSSYNSFLTRKPGSYNFNLLTDPIMLTLYGYICVKLTNKYKYKMEAVHMFELNILFDFAILGKFMIQGGLNSFMGNLNIWEHL